MSRVFSVMMLAFVLSGCRPETHKKGLPPRHVNYVLSGGSGFYDYAPSAIETDSVRYIFLCQNKDPFKVVDHIYLYKGMPGRDGYRWGPGKEVLAPSDTGWDDVHVCDPDVRAFRLTYKGEVYNWIMTYLGVDRWDGKHNRIGLAFAKQIEGPYIKYDKNPVIAYGDTSKWGAGQSTSVVLDTATIQLFYSRTDVMCVRNIKPAKADSMVIGREHVVPYLHTNTYVAFSQKSRYAVSELRRRQSKQIPTWVGNHIRLLREPLSESLSAKEDGWEEIGFAGPDQTGFPRNHNPGFLTDDRGYLPSDSMAVVYFTTAVTGENWLWSYHLYSAEFDLTP
ncbi:hypothetical protein GCM10023143_19040 [Compostibacter hankyongensis]|uniref:DUF4185 domain-containing protein n=2 Tax=Compostibacter hankyongensis TaxID=1007089 RepID=A0ABP8FT49_9BACT